MKKKKILFIIYHLYNGGAEKSLVNLLNEFDFTKYDVDLFLLKKEGIFLNELPREVNIISDEYVSILFGAKKFKNVKYKFFRYLYSLMAVCINKRRKKQLRWSLGYKRLIPNLQIKYDVAISFVQWEPLYYLVDKVSADKKIAWIHTDCSSLNFSNETISFINNYFNKVDNVVTISSTCANSLEKVFSLKKEKIRILENITSSKKIREKSTQFYPKEYNKDKICLLSIGRLIKLKGFDVALDVAKLLKEKYKLDIEWYFIGDGELLEELEKKQQQLDIMSYTKFIGTKSNPYPYILNADLIVQTSFFEGKSMVIDEAKMLGRPIVITNYNSAKDQIKVGKEGIITDFGAENIASNIYKILSNKELYNSITSYLKNHDYDNLDEINKYYSLIEKGE